MGDEIECDIQAPVFLAVPESGLRPIETQGMDTGSKNGTGLRTGCQVIEVKASQSFSRLVFRNYYTYSVIVRCLRPGSAPEDRRSWATGASERVLMPNCHAEEGSQDWVTIDASHFPEELRGCKRLRLILKQPSPDWMEFGIHFLSCYSTVGTCSPPNDDNLDSSTVKSDQILSLIRQMAFLAVKSHNEVLTLQAEKLSDISPFYSKLDSLK